MRWQFTCLHCGESSDVDASQTTVSPSWVLADCLSCEQQCARSTDGWRKLALVKYGADWVVDDPLTEWDVLDFAEELERVGLPLAQLEAETA